MYTCKSFIKLAPSKASHLSVSIILDLKCFSCRLTWTVTAVMKLVMMTMKRRRKKKANLSAACPTRLPVAVHLAVDSDRWDRCRLQPPPAQSSSALVCYSKSTGLYFCSFVCLFGCLNCSLSWRWPGWLPSVTELQKEGVPFIDEEMDVRKSFALLPCLLRAQKDLLRVLHAACF